MAVLNAYLNFLGNTEEAFNFYKSVFGGEFLTFQRFKDTPACDQIQPADQNKVMHVALAIGQNVLMGTDTIESMGQQFTVGNNISLSLNTESKEETDRLFNALSQGGTVGMPLQDMFWGAYFGMCTDKFGIQWMFNYAYSTAGTTSP